MEKETQQPDQAPPGPRRRIVRSLTFTGEFSLDFKDREIVPSSLPEITHILRVAKDIEIEDKKPQIAYLCRKYAYEKAEELDPYSKCRGVRQFKTSLLQKLEDDRQMVANFQESSAAKELCNLFLSYIQKLKAAEKDRVKSARMCITAEVLYDVLLSHDNLNVATEPEICVANEYLQEKKEIYSSYNILPLRASQPTDVHEVDVVLAALRNIQNLPVPSNRKYPTTASPDLLDWLQVMFGFQKDNVSNQREHIVLLLANRLAKVPHNDMLSDIVVGELLDSLFQNYENWCKFLGHKSAIWHQSTDEEDNQVRKLLYIGLYLLIWGEAANLRFMPECLCYIFHHMALEIPGMLASTSIATAYGGEQNSFLKNVVTPIYNVIQKESQKNRNGTAPHSDWRNYDDLNEYFWSKDCFSLRWPWKEDAEFFQVNGYPLPSKNGTALYNNAGKLNYVEIRSFWHIFRSFDRMWTFYILILQVMLILSWTETRSLFDLFQMSVLENILSIFITAAVLRLLQVILDIVLNFKAYSSKTSSDFWRPLLKLGVALFWVVILPVCYLHSWNASAGLLSILNSWLGPSKKLPSLYIAVVVIYMLPNVLNAVLFLFPFLRTWIESSEHGIIQKLLLWSEPRLYIGRGMRESNLSVFKYTLFWTSIIIIKIIFSYFVQVKPLVKLTKAMTATTKVNYKWHELFPHAKYNVGAVISTWAPVMLVYFMDTQIWYALVSSFIGGVIGTYRRLGEVRTLDMLRSRFLLLPEKFNEHLVVTDEVSSEKEAHTKFGRFWNAMISSFREEDIINNWEKELLLFPSSTSDAHLKMQTKQWPPFLLVSKVPTALELLEKYEGKDQDKLSKRISADSWTQDAIEECYEFFKLLIKKLIVGEAEKEILKLILEKIDDVVAKKKFVECCNIQNFNILINKVVDLINALLENHEPQHESSTEFDRRSATLVLLQNLSDIVRNDIMKDEESKVLWDEIIEIEMRFFPEREDSSQSKSVSDHEKIMKRYRSFDSLDSVDLSFLKLEAWKEQIKRLHLLLTHKESAMGVPANLEARRRITFFCNSVFMKMPKPPRVSKMLPFSVLTPYFKEETIYSKEHLFKKNEDGISILFYLKRIYPDEWENFKQRMHIPPQDDLEEEEDLMKYKSGTLELDLSFWASSRGQTLFKTIKGMMYYQRALQLQALVEDSREGDHTVQQSEERTEALVSTKFTYVVSCQQYGYQRRSRDQHAADILRLMHEYPSLRVAYIDESESNQKDKIKHEYFSVLVKAADGLEEEIYRIKLPGNPILGEGKPENQNHAIIFTRGEALQAIDMNQGNYLEEAFKMRNLLEEFDRKHGNRNPTILGVRENIFTGSVSSLAWFMSNQENAFVTLGQRVLANPLKTRFYYGHPDVLSRVFHITRGGVGKASRAINLSEDIFAGFNSTLRKGSITHHEYIQVAKGRDVGLNQISKYEAKAAYGNGEQALSRDIYRLGHRFDFFRMLSCYFTTIGPYVSSTITVITVYMFLYGRLYLALSGVESSLLNESKLKNNIPLEATLACQSLVQLGLLISLPIVVEIVLEGGFLKAVSEFILMQLQLISVFFTFSLGTKVHHFCRAILHGKGKYRASDHGFVVRHEKFAANYRLYSRSHFIKGLELFMLLLINKIYGAPNNGLISQFLFLSLWFLAASWLFGPFLFNPSGLEWQKIVEDWDNWNRWFTNQGGIGTSSTKSWEFWWNKEYEYLNNTGLLGRLWEFVIALRFLLYQYALVFHLNIVRGNKQIQVYGLSWLVIASLITLIMVISLGKIYLDAEYQLVFRLFKALLFLTGVSLLILLFLKFGFTFSDLGVCLLAFPPTGWALLQISLATKPFVKSLGLWDTVKALARGYEYMIGLLLFAPVAVLSWFPFVSEFQSRLLFNQAFSRGLQISRILAGRQKVFE